MTLLRSSVLLLRNQRSVVKMSLSYSTSFNDPDLFKTKAFVNGKWIEKKESFEVVNPSTQEVIGQISSCNKQDYEEAIVASKNAFDEFRYTTPQERSQILYNIYDLIVENKEDLARLITLENGKPFQDSLGEVMYSASYFKWFAEEATRIYGTVIPAPSSIDRQIFAVRQPLGVVGILTPWNFPSAMIARKLAPALATGNTCIIKPAHQTPLSALALGWLCEQAGLPAGGCNILPTKHSGEIGKYLCSHDLVKKITFTGSTKVGRLLMTQCASESKLIKKISMELGGNAPFIVFEDADLEKALDGIIGCKFRQSGQTCICANRIFVHKNIYDEYAQKLTERIESTFCLGDGFEKNVTHGPLINADAVEKVSELVDKAKEKGARVLTGGSRASALGPLFYRPTVLADVDASMDIFHTEIFGPVASLIKFESTEEVLEMANDTDVGLAGYFYTKDIRKAYDTASKLEVGMVGINTGAISDSALPFGGIKNSGCGKEGSKYGIEDYTELRSIVLQP